MSEELQNIIDLAKAREILSLDAERHMPKGAADQRQQTMNALQQVIDTAIAGNNEILPPVPADADIVTQRAHAYVGQRQAVAKIVSDTEPAAYTQLKHALGSYTDMMDANDIVSWAQRTKASPDIADMTFKAAKAATNIFKQRIKTQPQIAQWSKQSECDTAGDKRNLALIRKSLQAAAALDENFVAAQSRAINDSENAWEEARPKNDFNAWLPHLEKVVTLTRQEGERLGATFNMSPYQALLDKFNPDLSNDTVNKVFAELRATLPSLIRQVMEVQAAQPDPIALPPVPEATQQRIAKRIMNELGLSEQHARLDISAHPFSTGAWDDVRITTRYDENNILSGIMGVVHEVGHAMYGNGLPREWKGQPVGEAQSMWVHESQSLFWEKQIASSYEFMEYLSKLLKEELAKDGIPTDSGAFEPDNLYRINTRVTPSLIRVDADALTYPLHVILRHDLEQKLIDGSLTPKDLPHEWNKGMQELLGVTVPSDAQGCMQDSHWAGGAIGYFPAYSFGALGAAQLMEKAKQGIPDMSERIRAGDFAPIRAWLEQKVHKHASLYSGEALIENTTGEPFSAKAWLKQANERYLSKGKWSGKANGTGTAALSLP